ncbi:MAG: tetratricopeptide repeat protein [Flavobacteriales bacterium]|nr:MAG: tetratricopeptide repeat protein [Flavobacteriales bacterium]
MKKQLIVIALLLVSATTFAQKKEIKTAQKSIKSGNFTEAITTLASIEGLVDKADSSIKEQYSLILAQAYLGAANNDFEKLNLAANLFEKVLLNKSSKYVGDASKGLEEVGVALINSAQLDQKNQNYIEGSKKIYRGYTLRKNDTIFLYYAASLATDGKDYDLAINRYEELMDIGYTGISEEFYATKKGTKEETKFSSKTERDLLVKKGDYVIPRSKFTKSKKGTILKNMTFIYLNKGEKEKATELMKKARAASPNDKSLMYAEAELYYTSGDMTNYKKIISELIKSDPNNPDLYYNLGVASSRNGEKVEAMEYYSMAIELNPDYAEALINKAQLILDGERTIIDEMNSLGTSNADYDRYDVLKEEKNKLYLEALPYLESASRLRPESMDIVKTLKGIYGLLGMDTKEKEMRIILDQN